MSEKFNSYALRYNEIREHARAGISGKGIYIDALML